MFTKFCVRKPEGKKERPRQRLEDIKICLKFIECDALNLIQLDENVVHWQALMNLVMDLLFP